MDFDLTPYTQLRNALKPQGILCQIQGRHQIAVSNQEGPIWPDRGNSFWVTIATGTWIIFTWTPRAYELTEQDQMIDLCEECMKCAWSAMHEIPVTIQVFLQLHAQHHESSGVYFAVKLPVGTGESVSHLWYNFIRSDGDKLRVEHFRIPEDLQEFERLIVDVDRLEDWMINDHGHLYGGWSIRVQRSRVPESEKSKFDEYAGIEVYKEDTF